mmetsp:Transcript_21827/g.69085  ORF Transcript_21827/g.69085 Transcript_21827/m.69085 type:complete len:136 (-) Transcript_21827:249-656(-)
MLRDLGKYAEVTPARGSPRPFAESPDRVVKRRRCPRSSTELKSPRMLAGQSERSSQGSRMDVKFDVRSLGDSSIGVAIPEEMEAIFDTTSVFLGDNSPLNDLPLFIIRLTAVWRFAEEAGDVAWKDCLGDLRLED